MNAQQMWERYSMEAGISADYDAWAFSDDADTLARLVLEGVKTATSSAHPYYELESEPLPKEGTYSVILDTKDRAVCVIRTERVTLVPFDRVDELHAWKEGEGDRSLAYWRAVHERFFRALDRESGHDFFHNGMKVVCEEFIRVYP